MRNQKFFMLNIYNGCDINGFLKKEFGKSHYAKFYKRQFQNYYDVHYSNYENDVFMNSIQSHIFENDNFTQFAKLARETSKTNTFTIFVDTKLINYFNVSLSSFHSVFHILNYGKTQKSFFSKFSAMAKNILTISCAEVEIERLFNMTKNVIIYRRGRFNVKIIEVIMLIKFAAFKDSSNADENMSFYYEIDESCADEFSVDAMKKLTYEGINDNDDDDEHASQKQNDEKMMKNLISKESVHEMKKIKNVDEIKITLINKRSRLIDFTSFFSSSTIIIDISIARKIKNIIFIFEMSRSLNTNSFGFSRNFIIINVL